MLLYNFSLGNFFSMWTRTAHIHNGTLHSVCMDTIWLAFVLWPVHCNVPPRDLASILWYVIWLIDLSVRSRVSSSSSSPPSHGQRAWQIVAFAFRNVCRFESLFVSVWKRFYNWGLDIFIVFVCRIACALNYFAFYVRMRMGEKKTRVLSIFPTIIWTECR